MQLAQHCAFRWHLVKLLALVLSRIRTEFTSRRLTGILFRQVTFRGGERGESKLLARTYGAINDENLRRSEYFETKRFYDSWQRIRQKLNEVAFPREKFLRPQNLNCIIYFYLQDRDFFTAKNRSRDWVRGSCMSEVGDSQVRSFYRKSQLYTSICFPPGNNCAYNCNL